MTHDSLDFFITENKKEDTEIGLVKKKKSNHLQATLMTKIGLEQYEQLYNPLLIFPFVYVI